MANSYRRIRPLPDPPLDASPADFRAYEVVAWVALLMGLVVFVALGLGAYFSWTRVAPSLTDSHSGTLTAAIGTVEVQEKDSPRWSIASQGMKLNEGDSVRTREGSRAFVTFFDLSTATLYPLTEITLTRQRTSRLGKPFLSTPYTDIAVQQTSGRALFGVAHLNPLVHASFEVVDGAAKAELNEGSHIVKVTPNQVFEVVTTRGSSKVFSAGREVTIQGGERTQVRANQPPSAPILAAEDLIDNGNFSQRDSSQKLSKWETVLTPPELNDVAGQLVFTTDGTVPVARFTRTKSTYHGENRIRQVVNQDVTDYNVVRLELHFKVFNQSVSGGGEQGSEYPLMVRVNYLDETGSPNYFVRGFYVQNSQRMPTTNGQQVPANQWITLAGESGIQLQNISPRPQFIQSVEVLASGHDYDSEIQRLALIVE